MKHGLDVVAVGIEREGCVVARVVGAFSRAAIVASTMLKSGRMEGVDAFPVPGLKRQMNPGNRAVGLVDPKFVAREMLWALGCEVASQSLQDSAVKLPTRFEVGDAEMDMIDQAALMTLHTN